MIKAIFWDNDGVLVETEALYFKATRTILQQVGIDLTEALYIEHFLKGSSGIQALAEPLGFTAEHIAELRQRRNILYSEILASRDTLIEQVPETLAELARHFQMAVVTSCRKEHFDLIHRRTGILQHFAFILAAGDYEKEKPHPAPYLKALEISQLEPSECLVIEDSERGLHAAKAAGLRCWVIPSGLTRGCAFSGADAVLGGIHEVSVKLIQSGQVA